MPTETLVVYLSVYHAEYQPFPNGRIGEHFHLSEDCDKFSQRLPVPATIGEHFHLSEDCDICVKKLDAV